MHCTIGDPQTLSLQEARPAIKAEAEVHVATVCACTASTIIELTTASILVTVHPGYCA